MAEEPTEIDLGPFLAAIVEDAGGEVRIPYSVFANERKSRAIAIDIEDDGMTVVLRLVDEIPDE